MKEIDIQTAIQGLQSKILTTDSDFIEYHNSAYDYNFPWRIDSCFLQLLALLEILELPEMRKMALQEYLEMKKFGKWFLFLRIY
ncbi:MAG: hypothetical protein U5R06_08735 [candidate division KSB1 bacterium]|nr:hypothetical protein [candidate division KSB1 bacterium]